MDEINSIIILPAQPDQTAITNENNKMLKRKVVSFSTMPFEKKVADGKENDEKRISNFIFCSLF